MKFVLLLVATAVPLLAQLRVHDTCNPCHNEQVSDFFTHAHASKLLSCDVCHGKSEKHVAASGAAAPDRVAARDEQPALCGTCHPQARKEFESSRHGKLVLARSKARAPSCGVCHGVHAPRTVLQMEQGCARCHTVLPPACGAHQGKNARCTTCHARHTMIAKRTP